PHTSFDFAYPAIRSATRESSLTFNHFKILKEIGVGDINKTTYSSNTCYYDTKVVNKKILTLKEKVNIAEME
ncbi:hypothetical protein F8388_010600, partial [Cannabis sativa]